MVKGVAALHRRFNAIPAKVRREVVPVIDRYGERIVKDMKFTAPEDERELIESIKYEFGTSQKKGLKIGATITAGDETTVVPGSNGFQFQNAFLQEVGTSEMAANPYFNVSLRANARPFRSAMTRAIRKALRKS